MGALFKGSTPLFTLVFLALSGLFWCPGLCSFLVVWVYVPFLVVWVYDFVSWVLHVRSYPLVGFTLVFLALSGLFWCLGLWLCLMGASLIGYMALSQGCFFEGSPLVGFSLLFIPVWIVLVCGFIYGFLVKWVLLWLGIWLCLMGASHEGTPLAFQEKNCHVLYLPLWEILWSTFLHFEIKPYQDPLSCVREVALLLTRSVSLEGLRHPSETENGLSVFPFTVIFSIFLHFIYLSAEIMYTLICPIKRFLRISLPQMYIEHARKC